MALCSPVFSPISTYTNAVFPVFIGYGCELTSLLFHNKKYVLSCLHWMNFGLISLLYPHIPMPFFLIAFPTRPSRPSLHPYLPFFPPEPQYLTLSVHPSPLRWGNSPPDDSLSDGQLCLLGFQTPAPVTRHAPHGREGQRKKERVCILPSAHVRTRMRAPARLYEKENYSKITCCRPP